MRAVPGSVERGCRCLASWAGTSWAWGRKRSRGKIGHLTLRDVDAALAYYHANIEEIEHLLAEEAEDYARLALESARAPEQNR